jgi:PelA/Pel-15E family pectate lyase
MRLDNPSPEVIKAVEGAVKWFDKSKIMGYIYYDKDDPSTNRGYERCLELKEGAGPLWARLYELDTNKPLFGDRDGTIVYSTDELSYERRTGYYWYTDKGKGIYGIYSEWQKKWTPHKSILK